MNTQINLSELNSKNVCVRKEVPTAMFNALILTSVTVAKETEKAILISGLTNGIGKNNSFVQAWVAKSIIDISDCGSEVTITLPEWYNNKFQPIS